MHASSYFKGDFGNQNIPVGRHNRNLFKLNKVASFNHRSLFNSIDISELAPRPLHLIEVNLWPDVFAMGEIVKDFFHFVNERGVACELLDLFVGDYNAADGLSQVNKKGGVADVVAGDC
jgi:hypothetical protein